MPPMPGFFSADYKVPGGKLLRVRLRVENGTIAELRMTGDFFMHPEDAIEELEQRLNGISAQENAIREALMSFFASGVEVIGADADDFRQVIMLALAHA